MTRHGVRGQSLVELALVLPVMVLLLAGGTDLARAYFVGIEMTDAARAGALYVSTSDPTQPGAPINTSPGSPIYQAAIDAYQGSLLSCSSSPVVTASPTAVPNQTGNPSSDSYQQTITVTCHLSLLLPLLPSPVAIRASSSSYVLEP